MLTLSTLIAVGALGVALLVLAWLLLRTFRTERELSRLREAATHRETANTELRQRLQVAEATLSGANGRLEASARTTAQLETKAAEAAASVAHREARIRELQAQLAEVTAETAAARDAGAGLQTQLATLRETLAQERSQAAERLALLSEARERMTQEFRLLADTVLQSHGETFAQQNQEQIEAVLGPLRLKIAEFQDGLQKSAVESTRERATLAEQIRALSETSARMTNETVNLTRALKGQAQTQGAWGEMVLASILERSGLRAGEEYFAQASHTDADGQRLRPDVVVCLPNEQRVVIDSKVSLQAFEAYVAAESDADRAVSAASHLRSLRTHIRGLSGKQYHDVAGSQLDFVVMFVPIEGALALALQQDPGLTGYAVENHVAIATPSTLMIALRTIANVWQVERRNRNAEEIARRAGLIYNKLAGFLDDMTQLGTRLGQARDAYDLAQRKLTIGQGNLVWQVNELKALGARTNRSLPAAEADAPGETAPDAAGGQAPAKDVADPLRLA